MATHLYVPESVLHAVERAKQWEQAYQYILTKEENVPSFSHILENDNLILKNGGNYRLDPCLGILENLTDISKYSYGKTEISTAYCNGNSYDLVSTDARDLYSYSLSLNIPSAFIKRFVLAVFSSVKGNEYKGKLYKLMEYLLDDYKLFHDNNKYTLRSNSVLMEGMGISFGCNYIYIYSHTTYEQLATINHDGDDLVFSYPHLEEFFGKLDGRLLTEDDVSLYEMVNGRKPLIYNLEEKDKILKIMLAK